MVVGIKFPRRAESVSSYADYKVFVDFWNPLTEVLTENYRRLVLRGETHILAVYGPQGAGKTLLGRQLQSDFAATLKGAREYNRENVWHRIVAPEGATLLSEASTSDTTFRYFSDDPKWLAEVVKEVGGADGARRCVAVADNAETYYFISGCLQSIQSSDVAGLSEEQRLVAAAQQLVNACRTNMSRTLLILLSNNMDFLQRLQAAVDAAHRGLMQIVEVPVPTALEKERAVRVNINRLNEVGYWYCLDSAGPDKKQAVYDSLRNADATFPSAFEAVDTALVSGSTGAGRTGRPARKNLLSLVCLTDLDDVSESQPLGSGPTVEAA